MHKERAWEIGSQDIPLKAKCNERETYFSTGKKLQKDEEDVKNDTIAQ